MRKGRRPNILSEDELAELDTFLADLIADLTEGAAIIVEGRADEEALRATGLYGRILRISSLSRSELLRLTTAARPTKVILLTDLDEKGRKLKEELSELLRADGLEVDETYWLRLSKICRGRICEVETVMKHWLRHRRTLNYCGSDY